MNIDTHAHNCVYSWRPGGFAKCVFVNELIIMYSSCVLFIDLKKAFDTVDHDILCKKNCIYMVCVVSHTNGFRVI